MQFLEYVPLVATAGIARIAFGLTKKPSELKRRGWCYAQGMITATAELECLTEKIIGCAIAVHREMGPGLLESVYRECLSIELSAANLRVESERRVQLQYRGQPIVSTLKVDLLVEGCVVVELKSVEQLHPIFLAQVITYLKLAQCPAGLLINFNATTLRAGLRRLDHPNLYKKKTPFLPPDVL